MQRTACAVARLHAVPVPDTLRGSQPHVWAKIRQFLATVIGRFTDPRKTQRFVCLASKCSVLKEVYIHTSRSMVLSHK